VTDTVFALTSGSYRAGVAVVRVSGPLAAQTFKVLSHAPLPPPRMAHLVTLSDAGKQLDRALALYFKAPASFTGEDVVEYHLHGGKAVIDGTLRALGKIDGCRLANPGEFTRRAFENGKLDLTEAEAIADLIAAETEAQRLQALDQLGGGLARLYGGWTESLKKILAHKEADIEFPDEDLPEGVADALKPKIETLLCEISAHLNDDRRGERLREGVLIAIIGAPNAGKSSLLNTLAQKEAAIVSDEAGTTRDVIEVHLDLGGFPVILADTAGLRTAENKIEAEGIRRAKDMAVRADLKIALFDPVAEQDEETLAMVDKETLVVFTKADLSLRNHPDSFSLSALTGAGLDIFLQALTAKIAAFFEARSGPVLTRPRHREALQEAADALTRSLSAAYPELAAEDLRLSLRALGKITGRVHIEELLDVVFRDFCIGK
jgi:tRNA modification GTPase